MKPLISVIIPTHNRYKYARHSITSILNIESDELELVVHDTSTCSELKTWIKDNISDHRLVYIHTNELLSMTDNYNRSIDYAKGQYVCLIGDDDSVCHTIINAARLALRENIDVLTPTLVVNYAWPDFKTLFFNHAGKMYLKKYTGKKYCQDTDNAIKKAINMCFQGTLDLPKVYHGLVKLDKLKELKTKTGQYFWGVSPDISGAIGIAMLVKNYHIIDYPITIPGASGGSNSGRSALNKHKGTLTGDPHMVRFKNEYWPQEIPKFFSTETVWAQAALVTLIKLEKKDWLKKFNVIKFHALCWFRHKDFADITKNNLLLYFKKNKTNLYKGWFLFYFFALRFCFDRVYYLIWRTIIPTASRGKKTFTNLKTIAEATIKLKKYIDDSTLKNSQLKVFQ